MCFFCTLEFLKAAPKNLIYRTAAVLRFSIKVRIPRSRSDFYFLFLHILKYFGEGSRNTRFYKVFLIFKSYFGGGVYIIIMCLV